MKKLFFLLSLVGVWNLAGAVSAVDKYSVAVQAGSSITMGDGNGFMNITVTNLCSSTNSIKYVEFQFASTVYNPQNASVAPAGWEIATNLTTASTIAFYTSGSPIALCGNALFRVLLTGTSGGNITAASSDQQDTLSGMRVSKGYTTFLGVVQGPEAALFSRQGSFPNWQRKTLKSVLSLNPPAVSSGQTLTLSQLVANRGTATLSNVSPSATPVATFTGSAGAVYVSGPTPAVISSLASGASQEFQWTYTASPTGTVKFANAASDSGGTSTSASVSSDEVEIGDFTVSLSLEPLEVVSGGTVTVTMEASNNGASSLGNVAPGSLVWNTSGSATAAVTSGPTPANISSLAPGANGTFQWTMQINGGTGGDSFSVSASASSSTIVSNTAVSNQGLIASYAAELNPSSVGSGSANVTFTISVTNRGGDPIQRVRFKTPAAPSGFVYQSASGPFNWDITTGGAPLEITFTSQSSVNDIATGGGTKSFFVTYSSVPTVISNSDAVFTATLFQRSGGAFDLVYPVATLNPLTVITNYSLDISAAPSSGIPADSNSQSAITANLTTGGSPASGKTVNFSASAGSLSSATAITDAGGLATVALTAPASQTDVSALVTASYQSASDSVSVGFTGVTSPNAAYVGGSLTPMSVLRGATGVSFSARVNNTGGSGVTLNTASTFGFSDGSASYTANLNAPVALGAGAMNVLLNFSATDVSSAFAPGFYYPSLNLQDGSGYSQTIVLTDPVTITAPNLNLAIGSDNPNPKPNDPGNGANPASVITYTITYGNASSATAASATSFRIRNKLPAEINYVVGSLIVNGTPKTDAVDGDGADYDPTNRIVTVNIGTVSVGGTGSFSYKVRVP